MSKAISFSLFGFDRERFDNCFSFDSYLRGLHINIRLARLLFPQWIIVLNVDEATYNSPYRAVFDWYQNKGLIRIRLFPNGEPLCKAMLRRLETVFDYTHPNWTYTHVICRDLDSIPTLREAQMVQEWIEEDKALHCITDSVSHTIPMMGGMVGFRPGYVNDIMQITQHPQDAFDKLLSMAQGIDYRYKGSDQDFLGRVMYPKLCQSATEHFILGMPHNLIEGNGRHYRVPSNSVPGVDLAAHPELEETNRLAGHVGAAGFYESPLMKFLYWNDPYKQEYAELENMPGFEKLFYWSTREDLR
jgi:hypothetical protein